MSQSRHLAVIMFMDIAGYTELMGKDEEKAFSVLNTFKAIAFPLVEEYGGKWIKDLGDGAMCSFGSTRSAIHCAIKIQGSLNIKLSYKLRIGLHSGEVTFKDRDVFGDGVNVASRIQSEAAPGGICISDSIYKTIKNQTGLKALFLGSRKLKNVSGKTRLYQISAPGVEIKKQSFKPVHPKDERVTIPQGRAYVAFGKDATKQDAKAFGPGDYYVNARNAIHTVWADSSTIIQITGIGPWEANFIDE